MRPDPSATIPIGRQAVSVTARTALAGGQLVSSAWSVLATAHLASGYSALKLSARQQLQP